MNRLDQLQNVAEQRGAIDAMMLLGITAGEISARQAKKVYKGFFLNAVERGLLKPTRVQNSKTGTSYYRVTDILDLMEKEIKRSINL